MKTIPYNKKTAQFYEIMLEIATRAVKEKKLDKPAKKNS